MIKRRIGICAIIASATLGCGKNGLDTADAGAEVSVDGPAPDTAIDSQPADGAVDVGRDGGRDDGRDGALDGIQDGDGGAAVDVAPLAGRKAFDVSVKLTFVPPSSGPPPSTFPTTASATVILDATAGWLLIGGEGQGTVATIQRGAGGMATAGGPLTLAIPYADACQGFATLEFQTLRVTVDGDGKLHGTGTGRASYISGDIAFSYGVSVSLDGGPDTTAPTLRIRTAGALDPLSPARFAASEPLPAGTKAQLVPAAGPAVELTPELSQGTSPTFVTAFRVPGVLAWGGSYRLVLEQVTDFAGNHASPAQGPPLATLAAPPLLMDGGFEATPAGMLGEGLVFGAGDLPAIAGTKSLLLDATPGLARTLTYRLAVQPGAKAVRFSYRIASTYEGAPGFYGAIVIGSVGSPVMSLSSLSIGMPTTKTPRMGGGTWTLGPISVAELALPDPGATEVALKIASPSYGCGLPPPPVGLIIDDVRAAR